MARLQSKKKAPKKAKAPIQKKEAAPVQPESSNTGPAQYTVIALNSRTSATPVLGKSYYIVLGRDTKKSQYILLHPFTLTKFELPYDDVRADTVECDWNPTPEKLVAFLARRIQTERDLKRMVTNEISALLKHYETLCEIPS